MGKSNATISITNSMNGTADIRIVHNNSDYGNEYGAWTGIPNGANSGSMQVTFDAWSTDTDWWWVYVVVHDGPNAGQYTSVGSLGNYWKECALGHDDENANLVFSVTPTQFNINEDSGNCQGGMQYIGPYHEITHVFVLMLENHSFDNIFAGSGIAGITAATTADSNSFNGTTYNVDFNAPYNMPTDPGHEFLDTLEQLCGVGATYPSGGAYPAINNSGFAANYATSSDESTGLPSSAAIGDIMKCFNTPSQLPALQAAASKFMLCDHWFSSIPGPTWPNRFFLHGASSVAWDSSPGAGDIFKWETVSGFTYPNGSIFDALNNAKIPFRLYADFNSMFTDEPTVDPFGLGATPIVAALKNIHISDIANISSLPNDLNQAYPYRYTFIEPNYGDVYADTYIGGSSHHPMDDASGANGIVNYVVNAVTSSPMWKNSLLIITYDEHGGFYDSVAPGACVAPGDGSGNGATYGFTFEQYGVRVPAVVVSPFVPQPKVDHTVYDHTSVLATIEKIMGLNPLTQRDRNANNLLASLDLQNPNTAVPEMMFARPEALLLKARPPLTAAQIEAGNQKPLPESGNLMGALGVVMKADIEMSATSDSEKQAIVSKVQQIQTIGDAKAYASDVLSKIVAQSATKTTAPPQSGAPNGKS